jgi:hypothetical protein
MPRDLNMILTAAAEAIKPPVDSVEAFRAQLTTCINGARHIYQKTRDTPAPGKMKALWADYLEALQQIEKKARALKWLLPGENDDFTEALKQEIDLADVQATCLHVPKGAPQRDLVADAAASMARSLIDPNPYRHPENVGKDLPAIDCPWRRRATLTNEGPWLTLAALIYEGATGIPDRDMMKACREIDKLKPRYVAKLNFQAPKRNA